MLSENIKRCRTERGLTQEALAVKLNVVRQTVSKWEQGKAVPDADMLCSLADALDVSVAQLLGQAEDPEAGAETGQSDLAQISNALAEINEQLAVQNRKSRKTRRIIRIVAIIFIVFLLGMLAIGITGFRANSYKHDVAGSTAWACTLHGKTYHYEVQYNRDYEIIAAGGDSFIANHVSTEQYDDANELAAHLKDYFHDHGGKVRVTEQENLRLDE